MSVLSVKKQKIREFYFLAGREDKISGYVPDVCQCSSMVAEILVQTDRVERLVNFFERRKEMKEKVEKALQTIRPALQADGGDVELVDVIDGVVRVRLKGACGGCPMSQMTLTRGVEATIKKAVPEIKRVEAV